MLNRRSFLQATGALPLLGLLPRAEAKPAPASEMRHVVLAEGWSLLVAYAHGGIAVDFLVCNLSALYDRTGALLHAQEAIGKRVLFPMLWPKRFRTDQRTMGCYGVDSRHLAGLAAWRDSWSVESCDPLGFHTMTACPTPPPDSFEEELIQYMGRRGGLVLVQDLSLNVKGLSHGTQRLTD